MKFSEGDAGGERGLSPMMLMTHLLVTVALGRWCAKSRGMLPKASPFSGFNLSETCGVCRFNGKLFFFLVVSSDVSHIQWHLIIDDTSYKRESNFF